jgi:hypothetical protein
MRGRRGRLSYRGMRYGTLCAEHAAGADAHPTVFDPKPRSRSSLKEKRFSMTLAPIRCRREGIIKRRTGHYARRGARSGHLLVAEILELG